jgi:GntR family transcriptional regulator
MPPSTTLPDAAPTATAQPAAWGGQAPAFSPLYQQIKGLILQSLQQGEWKPGEVIPSEFDLAARYKVSQGTVRKAVDELAADNLLVRRQGKRHLRRHARRAAGAVPLPALQPDDGTADSEGPAQRDFVDCRASAPAPKWRVCWACARAIRCCRHAACCAFPACPPSWRTSGCRPAPFKGLTAERLAQYHGPMYALFEAEFGVRMVRADEKIRAVLPDARTGHAARCGARRRRC